MANKIKCTCGHSWNKSSSSKKDMNICHICGKDTTMQMGGYVYPVNYVPQKENGGWLDAYDDAPQAENGIEGTMGGLTDQGFNYNGAWGGTMQYGGNLPGVVGSMYTRDGAPSKGPRRNQTDVTDASAQNGMEMKFYQEGLDWKPRNISRDGSVTKDDNGYWNPENWGKPVEIGSNEITMKGLQEMGYNKPLLGISDTGDVQMMYPGEDYTFDGESVTEYPVAQNGKTLPTIYTENPKDPRLKSYTDSLNLYKAMQMQDKLMGPGSGPSSYKQQWSTDELKKARVKNYDKLVNKYLSKDYSSEKEQFAEGYDNLTARKEDKKLINYYRSLGFTDKDIMFHASPDIVSDKIKAIGTYYDGTASSPIYKKPVQPVVYKKPQVDYKQGLTREDLIKVFSADGKGWTATPGQKADGYYRYKKGDKSYKVYTGSGGFSHAEIEKPVVKKQQPTKQVEKPQPKQEVIKKQEPTPPPVKKIEQLKPIEKPEVKKEEPKLPYRVDYKGGSKYFASDKEGAEYIKQLNKDFMENKIPNPGSVSGYYETKKKNGGWLDAL